MNSPTISRPLWVGDKSAVLVRALAACSGAEDASTGAFLERLLNEIATTRPAGLLLAEALREQANALHRLADAAMAPITDDAFAVLLDEHHRSYEPPMFSTGGDEVAKHDATHGQNDQVPAWIDRTPFTDLIRFAEQEMGSQDVRYEDREAAAALFQFEQEGRLHGVLRLFAARFIAETIARLDEYATAEAFIDALRAQAK